MSHEEFKDQMLMNWPERVWIYSPFRPFFLSRHAGYWLKIAGRPTVDLALEVGCGLGKGAVILARKMGFRRVVAFDLEAPLARRAALRTPKNLQDRISFFAADVQDIPFSDGQFDAVVNYGIIHHVLDWRRALAEIARVIKPGGIFYFEEIYPPLYANFLLKRMLRHPTQDRFDGPLFLETLTAYGFELLDGVKTGSRFGIVAAARRV